MTVYEIDMPAVGFRADDPAVWSAEGLVVYLPPDAQDGLLDTVTALSAPGSRLAADYVPDMAVFEKVRDAPGERWDRWGTSIEQLIYPGERNDVRYYLAALGWGSRDRTTRELFALAGIAYPDGPMYAAFADVTHIDARLKR